jgi:hypothetical protein
MLAKLIVEGREFPIEIQDPELQKLLTPKKKTGYERVQNDTIYYYVDCEGIVCDIHECSSCSDNDCYRIGNYYSDKTVAENNTRADKLMRQLRRFAVEHRESEINWGADDYKYYIRYGHDGNIGPYFETDVYGHNFGGIFFDSKESAKLAIKTFHDELIWYFTEYKDSL